LCFSHSVLSRSYFQHFKSFPSIFPQFKAKFDVDTLISSFPFSRCSNTATGQYTLLLNMTLLNNHTWYSLIANRKWLSILCSIYT
jgi:hypothetical protein